MDLSNVFQECFSEKDYDKYMFKWLNGIIDEIEFWDACFAEEGLLWKEGWQNMITYERDFTLDSYLEDIDDTVFLDVGSGPLSSCGSRTQKTNLHFNAVDPLAYAYKKIKRKYQIKTLIQPEFAMVERLNEKYPENTFDLVHMRNALDHSFNPIMGLLQLLYVCKVGGRVLLCHRDNEAVFEKYDGLHQWNLMVKEEHFLIWRGNKKFDVAELFGDSIEITAKPAIDREDLHEVVITKRKSIDIISDPLIKIYNERLFNKLLECLIREFYSEKEKKESKLYQYKKWLEDIRRTYLN